MVESMNNFELSPPLDLTHHLSELTKGRKVSQIKAFYKYFSIPHIANLAGGLPNPSYFPFDDLESKTALPRRFSPSSNTPASNAKFTTKQKIEESRVTVPHLSHEPNLLRRVDLNTALQYGQVQGYPPLYLFVREFALTRLHPNIPYKDGAEVILTCGNTDGLAKTLECFSNTWTPNSGRPLSEREGMLCEEFAYMNAVQTATGRGLNIVPVAMDAEGMLAYGHAKCLDNVLSNWDVKRDGGKRPHLMYTVTMGQNPTSGLLSVKRRKEIYEVCQKFDVLIIEDDPYFYIQFPHAANEFMQKHRNGQLLSVNHFAESNSNYQTSLAVPVRGTVANGTAQTCATTRMRKGNSSGSEFLDSLVPSYLSLDVDGRVIRLDTFSKTVAPGCRLGWLTAQPQVVERILRITETSTSQPSGFVQSLIAEMLLGTDIADIPSRPNSNKHKTTSEGWQQDGWIRWLEGLRANYQRRMTIMSEILEEGKFTTTTTPPAVQRNPLARKSLPVRSRRFDPVISCSFGRQNISERSCAPFTPVLNTKVTSDNDDSFELLHKTQIYDFNPPMAGMFLWLRMHFFLHPLFHKFSPERFSYAFWLFQTTEPYLVLLAPGTMFAPTPQIKERNAWEFFRLCFAAVDEEEIMAISQRFVRACHDFWEISDADVIQKLLDDDERGVLQGLDSDSMEEAKGKWMFSPLMC